MNIYVIRPASATPWNRLTDSTIRQAVVIADSPDDALHTHPDSTQWEWDQVTSEWTVPGTEWLTDPTNWPGPDEVAVELLGLSSDTRRRIVCCDRRD